MVCVEVRARAGHGIRVVCGCGRVPGTAGGAGGLRGERTRCAYGRKIGRYIMRRFASLAATSRSMAAAGRGEGLRGSTHPTTPLVR